MQVNVAMPTLHPGQLRVQNSPARFRVLACGRRWGKTRLGSALTVAEGLQGRRAWWIAPTYKVANVGWRLITQLAGQLPVAEIRRGDHAVMFLGGGEVAVRSADNPDSLRGEGLDLAVFDECAFIHGDAWTHAVRPALADRQGKALFISTPKGRNWFWRMYQQGIDEAAGEWAAWSFPTSDNPHIVASEIEAARQSLPELVFRQEFLAEFVDDAGGVFRRVMEAATATAQEKGTPLRQYAFGVDWGQSHDFTVIAVVDMQARALVHLDRFNQVDYTVQRARLTALAERFRPVTIIAELNAMGRPIAEQLARDGLPIEGFTTTNATKMAAIDALALSFERGEIAILNDPILIGELQAYEMQTTRTGLRSFSAPAGMHDDTVMALALAWQSVAGNRVTWQDLTGLGQVDNFTNVWG